MYKLSILAALLLLMAGCGKSKSSQNTESRASSSSEDNVKSTESYDPNRGEGKYDTVDLGTGLDVAMAAEGQKISEVKCTSCHKMTDERLVGPGWKGITERRRPEWIMNFITNPDPMIDKDPELQAQLEICLVRMPNQGLTDDEARKILEYMRQNDGVK